MIFVKQVNKQRLINMLCEKLKMLGQNTLHAKGGADAPMDQPASTWDAYL